MLHSPGPDVSVGATVHERLRRDIIFCRLSAGSKLRLSDLKARYGASISTLRESLSRLSVEGFVTTEGQRGFFVAPMTPENLAEIADARILLESHALRQSIAGGDTDWEARIVAAHHKLSRMEERMAQGEAGARDIWRQYDWEFHQALIMGCGSHELLRLHSTVFAKYLRYQLRVLTFRGDIASREHRALLDSALSRDADRAERVLRVHIEGGVADQIDGWP